MSQKFNTSRLRGPPCCDSHEECLDFILQLTAWSEPAGLVLQGDKAKTIWAAEKHMCGPRPTGHSSCVSPPGTLCPLLSSHPKEGIQRAVEFRNRVMFLELLPVYKTLCPDARETQGSATPGSEPSQLCGALTRLTQPFLLEEGEIPASLRGDSPFSPGSKCPLVLIRFLTPQLPPHSYHHHVLLQEVEQAKTGPL